MKRKFLELFGGSEVKRILKALDGHKTELGLVVAAAPDIANQLVELLQALVPVFSALHMDGPVAYITRACGLILAGVGGIGRAWKVLDAILKDTPPKAPTGAAVIAFLLFPAFASAQTQPVPDPVQSSNWYRISSGGTRYFTPGRGDTTELEGQLAAEISLPGKLTAEAFVRFQRTQGAEQSVAGLLQPNTFRSVVGSVLLRYDVAQWSGVRVELLAVAGVSWERDKGFDPADPHVWLIGGGARLSNKRGAFDLAIAHAGEVGGAGVSGKLVINQSESARYIATYVVPFSAARFRTNPGTFTTSVQLDVLKRSFWSQSPTRKF